MPLINEIVDNTPRMIKGFEKIIVSPSKVPISNLIKHYKDVPKGALEEVLLAYDNRTFRYSLRVSGRGKELKLIGEKMKILYDCIGPVSAEQLNTVNLNTMNITEAIEKFIVWIKENC